MLRRATALGAGLLLIGIATVAWRVRSSTAEGYRALWRRFSDDKWVDSKVARVHESVGVYGVVVLGAAIGGALIISALKP